MKDIENILLIKRGAIGDIIFTLPAYHLLKENFPNAKITYLTKEKYTSVLKGFPGLDQVLTLDSKVITSKNIMKLWKMTSDLFHTIRAENYQLVIDFSGHLEQAFILWLCGIKHRWGSVKSKKLLHPLLFANIYVRQFHSIRNIDPAQTIHIIDQHLKLLEQGGLTPFPINNKYIVPEENLEKAKALFNKWGLSLQKPTIFIQPFTNTTTSGKIWPLDHYVTLAEYWKNKGAQVVFGGGPSDLKSLKNIATRFPVAAGQSDFITSIGLCVLSSIVVGGDTGLMHAALAAGKRTVMLVGPTNYRVIGPYKHPEWVVTPPTGYYIEDISLKQVIEATETAFNEIKIVTRT